MPLGSGETGTVAGTGDAARRGTAGQQAALQRSAELDFGDLLLEHLSTLYARARGLERSDAAADDLVQDTLERALRKFNHFSRGSDLRRWLLVIMQNLFTDRWRERSRIRGANLDLSNLAGAPGSLGPASSDADVPNRWELATLEDVREALALVDEPLRTAFELRFFEHLSYQEVAARTGVPVATVGTRILRARLRVTSVVDQLDLHRPSNRIAALADA
jgi:RNA polymerase sigma-70 factor (ECF subfamily)